MPNRDSRRYMLLPSGLWVPLERCDEAVWLAATRREADSWLDQFPQLGAECQLDDNWLVTTIAESRRKAHLHTALARMSDTPNTAGLLTNLRRTKETSVLYGITGSFEVALAHRHTAFEGGLGRLLEVARAFEKGLISMPPSLTRLREIESSTGPRVDIIVLPPSPLMSNLLRLQLAAPVLVRRSTLATMQPRAGR